jgi:KRAB domain-containing zinc finger protein
MFTSGSEFTAHALNHNPSVVTCDICCLVLDPKNRLKHLVDAHGVCACAKCDAIFASEGRLNNHAAHAHENGLRSYVCQAWQNSRAELRSHIEQHPRSFLCEICGRGFLSGQMLRMHALTHEDPRLECNVCGTKCRMKDNLVKHMQTHFRPRKLRCEFCRKRFASQASLRKHKKIHDAERAMFDFLVCKRRFARPSKLKEHMKLHRGELDHECDQCDAAFIRKDRLVRHRLEKHNIKEYKCQACGLEFEKFKQLNNHNHQQHYFKPGLK